MLKDLFPSFRLLARNIAGVTHILHRDLGKDDVPRYLWTIRIDGIFGGQADQDLDSLHEKRREQLAPFGTITPLFVRVGSVHPK